MRKTNPGKVSFGSSGNGAAAHLTTELLKTLTGTYMVHIPYRGAAAALTDLMGGQIQLFFDAASGLINPGQTGKVRLIGVASEKRLPALPDVPTFIEQGVRRLHRQHLGRHPGAGRHAARDRQAHVRRGGAHRAPATTCARSSKRWAPSRSATRPRSSTPSSPPRRRSGAR